MQHILIDSLLVRYLISAPTPLTVAILLYMFSSIHTQFTYIGMYMYMFQCTHNHTNSSHGRCCGFFQRRPFVAHWTAQSEFSELVMERSMLRDHTPYRVLEILTRLQKQERLLSVS